MVNLWGFIMPYFRNASILVSSIFLSSMIAYAQDESDGASEEVIEVDKENKQLNSRVSRLESRMDEQESDFWSYFGVGASIQYHLNNGAPRVKDALVDSNGIVRVNRESRANTGLLLEAHVLREEYCFFIRGCKGGPFVAATPGSDAIIDNLGVGYMVEVPGGEGFSMNLGLGVSVNPNSQELRGVLQPDQPLPADFDQSIGLTKETSRSQVMFVVSFSAN
ncbi:MAG: hypothetical protein AAFZ91_14585 [Pseudomonadota bacterium]